ncbi:RimJ/RimL family protein N-acetyltransferase [Kribbella aluminosa]|uniref:RimJ/RimL family protein N-acetyltransferase n=1 Tax=Kribbella aluminosa TaxID=416017 RepID=A0ABS4UDX2_9ACTN|nr:GNAT family N-acetyltransferase [Kribbella aluminosa]MBP2349837.1 RimJ/RimL family protein N-acetyltransferase [Kribbella aluminosa]
MNIRTTVEADLGTILALIEQKSVNTVTAERYREYVAAGYYKHDWSWVAEENGAIQALAIWWGVPDEQHPYSIDGLYYVGGDDQVPVWTELLKHAVASRPDGQEPPEYHFFLDSDWENEPDVVAALEPRMEAAAAVGMTSVTDRLRYEWKPAYGLPQRSTRLRFEPADDEAFVDVFMRVSQGSLDASTAREIARLGVEQAAREELAMYKSMPGDRGLWRVAYDGAELVGFAMPSANAGGPVVGYLGVVPEHRGRGLSDDLLAEITHLLAETGAEQIRADTDFGNVPMARSFERLGYRKFAVRRVLSFPEN